MIKPTIIAALACCLLLPSCKEDWTDENKRAYLESCGPQPGMTAAQSDKYCHCMLDVTMQHYQNIDEVIANKDSAAMATARADCSAKAVSQ